MRLNCPELRLCPRLLLSWLLLLASEALGDVDRCAICGKELLDKHYLVTDNVTEEKKHICPACAELPKDCFLCGLPVKDDVLELPDGRFLCARDAKTAVLDQSAAEKLLTQVKETLDRTFSRFLSFPDTNVEMEIIDRVNLQELFKFPGNDYSCPNVLGYIRPETNHGMAHYKISLLSGLPRAQLKGVIAHEYSHAWVFENVPARRRESLSQDAHEGFCELVAYLLMDAQGEAEQKKAILRNHYTRGQVDLFIEAERRYGLNDIADWMKYGTDGQLSKDELAKVRNVEMPPTPSPRSNASYVYGAVSPPQAPSRLTLNGIFWVKGAPLALINNHTFGVQEEASCRVGDTNVSFRILAINQDSVRILLIHSGKEQELRLPSR